MASFNLCSQTGMSCDMWSGLHCTKPSMAGGLKSNSVMLRLRSKLSGRVRGSFRTRAAIVSGEDKFDSGDIRKLSTVKMCHGRYLGPIKFKENNGDVIDDEEKKDVSQATLIWRAVKLPIYSVALVPLTVASAVAYLQTGEFSARRYLGLLVSSIFIITWLNLSNDVYDFDTGADKDKKESVVNIVGSRTGTLYAANLLLVLGFLGLIWVARQAGNLRSILLLFCSVMCGYVYQCPPFRLSYQGLGEPLCFASFGPFTTTAFYLLQITSREMGYHQPLTSTILAASILVGYTTTLILFCSHFHQVEGDRAVGKFSPLVRVGRKAGSEVVKMALVALYACLFILGFCNALPLASIVLCALTIPMGSLATNFVEKNYNDNQKIFMAKYFCVRLHALFGVALAAGLIISKNLVTMYHHQFFHDTKHRYGAQKFWILNCQIMQKTMSSPAP